MRGLDLPQGFGGGLRVLKIDCASSGEGDKGCIEWTKASPLSYAGT